MKKKLLKELLIIFIIVGFSISSIPTTSLNIKNENITNDINNKTLKSKEFEIIFSDPQIKYHGKYAEISLKEANSNIIDPGKPMLPKYNTIMKFPLGTKIKNIEISLSDSKQITLSKDITSAPYPVVGPKKLGFINNIFNRFKFKNLDVYPKEWFGYKTGGGLDDSNNRVTFLSIDLYPVKYFHKSDKIEYVNKIKLKIDYKQPENMQTFQDIYDLLILAPSEYSTDLEVLVEHKNNLGILTKLVTLEEIDGNGRDKQEQIKYFIKDSIENWGVKYVLLVGDKTRMPVRYTYPMSLTKFYDLLFGETPTDLYYADIYDSDGKFCSWDSNNDNIFGENTLFYSDEVDLYPDVAIGRLYCNGSSEVVDVVNKIIGYETEVYGQDWFNNIAICGGNTHSNLKDLIFLILPAFRSYFGSGQIANEGEYIGNKISDILINFNSEKYYASSKLPENKLTCDNINNAINNGVGFIFFIGHGYSDGWATFLPGFFKSDLVPSPSGYTINEINNLNNENKYPIIIFDACSCGDFRESNSPIAWEAVKLKSKGAIATFAATAVSLGYPGTYSEKGVNNLIDLGIAQAISNGNDNAGDLLKSSINNYLNTAVSNPQLNVFNSYIIQIQELFGDPTLKIGGYR